MQYLEYNECEPRGTFGFPVELYQVDENHPRYQMSFHWHREYEFIRILSGELLLTLDEKELLAKKGDVFFINGGTLHKGIADNCVYECIVLDLAMLSTHADACQEIIQKILAHTYSITSYFTRDNPEIYRLIWNLFDTLIQKPYGYQLIFKGILYQFLGLCFQQGFYATDTLQSPRNKKRIVQLKQVLEHIETSFATPITLEELSALAGMSPKYFCRFFKEMTQKTPMDYLNFYRIEQACYLLRMTEQPITSIAFSCGFNDLSYFIKTFKKYK